MRLHLAMQATVMGLFLSLLASQEAGATTFTFTKIADTTGSFSFLQPPSINNKGKVAFEASLDAGGEGIFTGSGGQITTITDTKKFATTTTGPLSFSVPSINDRGTVAFTAVRRTIEANVFVGIFTGNGGPLTTIVDASGPYNSFGPPSLNNAGKVAFNGQQRGVGNGIFTGTGNGNPITTIANTSGSFVNFNSLSINDSEQVAFEASLKNTGNGVFIASNGITTIADTSGPFRYFVGASINNEGAVAFRAGLQDQTSERIVIARGSTLTTVAESNISSGKPFVRFQSTPSINKVGMVAFEAFLGGGKNGIFTGPNPLADKVIASGDSLFGSTVTTVDFLQSGLNDAGQVAFVAKLADGTQVIVRAAPNTVCQYQSKKQQEASHVTNDV